MTEEVDLTSEPVEEVTNEMAIESVVPTDEAEAPPTPSEEPSADFVEASPDDLAAQEVEKEAQTKCPRCGGDGHWHTPKTGARLATMSPDEVKIDKSKTCPVCE